MSVNDQHGSPGENNMEIDPDLYTEASGPEDNEEDKDEAALVGQPSIEPIVSMEQLLQYGQHEADSTLVEIKAHTKPLATNFSERYKLKADGTSCSVDGPKLLVCHDFKGGYGHDKYVNGTHNPENYTFNHWLQTDIFVYFAHKFVTIPPLGWINAGAMHGVTILGTIITEWKDGEKICKEMLKSSEQIDVVVDKLCQINNDYMFDGYLVNIENPVENVPLMVEFVEKLTKKLHEASPKNLVIWYDSVINSGQLKWQNELNELNKQFFDVCDGIFLNYNWKEFNLQSSIQIAAERSFDVFVGVDVFGRGCYGGGGLNTKDALAQIEATNRLSTAIFAPGWSFETQPYKNFPLIDNELWGKCFENFRFKCWTCTPVTPGATRATSSNVLFHGFLNGEETMWSKNQIVQTDFNRGFGQMCFKQFQCPDERPWFNLCNQSLQPVLYSWNASLEPKLGPYESVAVSTRWTEYNTDAGFQGGGCLTCPDFYLESLTEMLYKICFPLDIPLPTTDANADEKFIVALCVWKQAQNIPIEKKNESGDRKPVIGFTFRDKTQDQQHKIISTNDIAKVGLQRQPITFKLDDLIDPCATDSEGTRFHFSFNFDENGHNTRRAGGWNFSADLLSMSDLAKFGPELQAAYIGNCEGLSIGYFRLMLLQKVPNT